MASTWPTCRTYSCLPARADALSTTKNAWYVSYAFEQTFWRSERDPQRAVGLFGQVALSYGNPNPARWSSLGGLSGTSPIPGRGGDRIGVAAFYLGVSDDLKDGLRPVRLGIEYGGRCSITSPSPRGSW